MTGTHYVSTSKTLSSGASGDMVVEFREYSLQAGVVEITRNNQSCLRMCSLLFANGSMQFFHGIFSISIWGICKLSEQIERSTLNHGKLSRAVTVHRASCWNPHLFCLPGGSSALLTQLCYWECHVSVKIMTLIQLWEMVCSCSSSILFARETEHWWGKCWVEIAREECSFHITSFQIII